ncbi:MAG: 50S ribosomal protein L11 methyltransferase [Opitutales bacterium]|nr:50S ribosomal protein L11 methyltransferase [Opitutales bacterium]
MIKISAAIDYSAPLELEEYFCERELINWGTDKKNDSSKPVLFGYFENFLEAQNAYIELRKDFPSLPEKFEAEEIFQQDWQNEYKKYLKPWSFRNLHWIPVWERGKREIKKGECAFYFDAGLAFGTGDHPTTRLCAVRILDYIAESGDVSGKFLIDAGCGSGILSISAKMLGFGEVYGFDKDPEAVRISLENLAINGLKDGDVKFEEAGIAEGLSGKKCDILIANIQADILCLYAKELVAGVKSGGRLVLSGILASENADVKKRFLAEAAGRAAKCESAVMGEWSDILIVMK